MAELVKTLERKLSIFSESAAGPNDADARRSWQQICQIDAEELRVESFGVELLHAVGFVYSSKAKHFLASQQSLFGVGGWLHGVQNRYHVFSETSVHSLCLWNFGRWLTNGICVARLSASQYQYPSCCGGSQAGIRTTSPSGKRWRDARATQEIGRASCRKGALFHPRSQSHVPDATPACSRYQGMQALFKVRS